MINCAKLRISSKSLFTMDKNKRFQFIFCSLFNNLKNASLKIVDSDQIKVLGDVESTLQGEIVIYDRSAYREILTGGSIRAAELYITKKWDSPCLTTLIQVMARNLDSIDLLERKTYWLSKLHRFFIRLKRINTEKQAKKNIVAHYDLGNEFYANFLDEHMQYSCAMYLENDTNLTQAQMNKMEVICQKLALNEQDKVLEVGTGWGSLAIYMATHFGCHVTTTTISDAQFAYAQNKIKKLKLTDKITLLKQDYRQLSHQYTKLVSIEMIEAVGHEYFPTFFKCCYERLKPKGIMLLQAITIADERYDKYRKDIDFIQKYIFPGGCLPSLSIIKKHTNNQPNFKIVNMENIGLHYARTIYDWRMNFKANQSSIYNLGYEEDFNRLWKFYLCYCEGSFLEHVISAYQIVLEKGSVEN